MKNTKFKTIVLLFTLFPLLWTGSKAKIFAQDVHFSQYNETPQLLNPGATGVYSGYVRAIVNYKNQWAAMGNAFSTVAASVDLPMFDKKEKNAHLGAGINFFSDKAGDSHFGLSQANLCLAAILPVSRESKFSMGISVGGAQHKATLSGLTWGNQYDGDGFNTAVDNNEPNFSNSFFYVDLAAGMYYEYSNGKTKFARNEKRKVDVGVAYFHLNRPTQKYFSASEKLYGKLVVNLNGHLDRPGTQFAFLPSFIFFLQGPSMEATAGCAVRYRLKNETKITGLITESAIGLGLYYRYKDAIIPSVFVTFSDFSLGISYDLNVSSYQQASLHKGGVEVSLKYHILKGALFKQKNMI